MADMLYDGKTLSWSPKGEPVAYSFKATSGLLDDDETDFRTKKEMCTVEKGPIPEGIYSLSLLEDSAPAQDDGKGECNLLASARIQTIPRGKAALECEDNWANWGYNRVRLEPNDQKTRDACKPRRDGFYLHDSAKGYTHGCIETEKKFFTILRKYARSAKDKRLTLEVKYSYESTYGRTDQ